MISKFKKKKKIQRRKSIKKMKRECKGIVEPTSKPERKPLSLRKEILKEKKRIKIMHKSQCSMFPSTF